MEGLFYSFEATASPAFHLLRFYPDNGYVLAKVIHSQHIDDVSKELKKFALDGHKLIGPPEDIYWGTFSEYDAKISFKIENELRDPSSTWAQYDLLTFKGTIVSENELQLEVTSKRTKIVVNRTYKRVEGNKILQPS